MGIKNTTSILNLCYIEDFEILKNLCYFLRCIHEIEFKGKKRVKFTRDTYHMAQEILLHIDLYILSEISKKDLVINTALKGFLIKIAIRLSGLPLGILAGVTGKYILKFILDKVSKHALISDIGATTAYDHDSKTIDTIYDAIQRPKLKKIKVQCF